MAELITAHEPDAGDVVSQAVKIALLERDLQEARVALMPLLNLMASIREALGSPDHAKWPQIIRKLRAGELDATRYAKLVARLRTGELEIRGIHFVMLGDDAPLASDFDAEVDSCD